MAITATMTPGAWKQPQVGLASRTYTMVTSGTYITNGFLPGVTDDFATASIVDIAPSVSRGGYVGHWNSATSLFMVSECGGALSPLVEYPNATALVETFIIEVVGVPGPPIV